MDARSYVLWSSIALTARFCCQSRGEEPALRLCTTTDGLVRNWVNQIRRDARGSLWLCTAEGPSLFDGRQFTNYTVKDG